jgi:protein TonB
MPVAVYSPAPPAWPYPRKDIVPVTLIILVDEDGKVSDPRVARSSGSQGFDHDAAAAVLKWRFTPCTCNGGPRPVRIGVEMKNIAFVP